MTKSKKRGTVKQVSNSTQRITPPSGRSYVACFGERVTVCPTCQGEGHHDSCFDCGNRGYFVIEQRAVDPA